MKLLIKKTISIFEEYSLNTNIDYRDNLIKLKFFVFKDNIQ